MNFYPHHIGDYRSATAHLTNEEDLAYRRLLEMYYDTERAIPVALQIVSRKLRISEESLLSILGEFFELQDDGYHHARCDFEIVEYNRKADIARKNGKLGGRRKEPKANPVGTQRVSDPNPALTQPLANQEPRTSNQEPVTNENLINPVGLIAVSDAANQILLIPDKPDCPHKEIIAIYHEVLPQCPKVRDWTSTRAQQLRARWNEEPKRQNLDYWRQFFKYVGSCDFLVGKGGGERPFFADLEWITKSKNFTKIREEKYASR